MEKTLQFALSELTGSFMHKGIFCLCDKNGRIADFINEGSHRHAFVYNELFRTGEIGAIFDLKGIGSLDDDPAPIQIFQQKSSFVVNPFFDAFVSTLDIASIAVKRVEPGLYLCNVRVSDLFPNFFPEKTSSIIYVDRSDKLVGFNQTFYNYFAPQNPSPAAMLGQPVDRFFTPTPKQLQEQGLSSFDPAMEEEFKSVVSRHFLAEGLEGFSLFPSGSSLKNGSTGMDWDNSASGKPSTLTWQDRMDTQEWDFIIRLRFQAPPGQEPYFEIGRAPGDDPDQTGEDYLAGPHATLPGSAVIKRRGFIAAMGSYPHTLALGREREMAFYKAGRGLHFFVDGKKAAAYYDHQFLHRGEARLSLGLRPGGRATIRFCTLLRRKSKNGSSQGAENILIMLRSQGRRHFLLNRFDNNSLSSGFPEVSGFLLQDITDLQNRMHELEGEYERQLREGRELKTLVDSFRRDREIFIGSSAQVLSIKDKVRIVAGSKATILIEGPTGTGKEVLARYIHSLSGFKNGPFVKVDCSTLPRELMESELFGHEMGSFTGAVGRKIGMVEQANKGTLFLDEVANLTMEAQAKLLQFLQDFTIYRVGGQKPIPLDLRVVGASNIRLAELTRRGVFREDLYYRLCVIDLLLPPLSERMDDLTELCAHFLDMLSATSNKQIRKISPAAFEKLQAHTWPGNIRELKNVLQRAVLFCQGEEITEDLILIHHDERPAVTSIRPPSADYSVTATSEVTAAGRSPSDALSLSKRRPTSGGRIEGPTDTAAQRRGSDYHSLTKIPRERFVEILNRHKGNIAGVTRELKVTRRALYYHLERLKLDIEDYRA